MTQAVDALLIRSLPELDEAATALDELEGRIGLEVSSVIQAWITNNGWAGVADWDNETWLAPPEWMVPGDASHRAYLLFKLDLNGVERPNYWEFLSSLIGCGDQRLGLWLEYDTYAVKKSEFNRLWRDHSSGSPLPLCGSEFFLPLTVDREALASSIEKDTIVDALEPIREALDRVPQLASQLLPLKRAIETAAKGKKAG